jgi:hypothetical protein
MPLRFFVEGEIMDDSDRYARFATHLNSKKAGPLVCPICNATESFEAKGAISGPSPDPLAPTDLAFPADPADAPTPANPRFNYASCTNCGYSIFFDTEASGLLE